MGPAPCHLLLRVTSLPDACTVPQLRVSALAFPPSALHTPMASAGTAFCQGPQACSPYAARELSARQDQAKAMQSKRVSGKLLDPALALMHGKR